MAKEYLSEEQWEAAGRPVPTALVRRYSVDSAFTCECEVPMFNVWSEERAWALENCPCIQKTKETWESFTIWSVETVSYVVEVPSVGLNLLPLILLFGLILLLAFWSKK